MPDPQPPTTDELLAALRSNQPLAECPAIQALLERRQAERDTLGRPALRVIEGGRAV